MSEIWSPQKASDWYRGISPVVGCNYLPRTAINSTDMWQAQTFDPATIDEELGWAAAAGYNSLRVFLQYIVWRDDPDGLLERIDRFLSIAAGHGITAAFILFDDCAFAGREPYLGDQDPPRPGIHNSGWTPSPGLKLVEDRSVWPQLEAYARAIVGAFGQDGRVLLWDLYNEPGNSDLGERSTPLVEAAFAWARRESPQQPLTTSVWRGNREAGYQDPMSQVLFNSSDVVSFPLLRTASAGPGDCAVQVIRPARDLHRVAAPSLRPDRRGHAAGLRPRADWLVPVGARRRTHPDLPRLAAGT